MKKQSDESQAGGKFLRRPRLQFVANVLGPLTALICVVVFFAVADWIFADGSFSSFRNLRTITVQSCAVAVAALGMTVIIIAGGIDLSAGAALALCATTLAWGLREDVAFYCRHQTNFYSASQSLQAAHEQLSNAERRLANADQRLQAEQERANPNSAEVKFWKNEQRRWQSEAQRWQTDANQRRDHLLQLLEIKRQAAQIKAEAKGIEKKIGQLGDPSFRLQNDPRWLKGVDNSPWTGPLAVLIGLGTGLLTGLVNGLLISLLRVVPFIITLGTMTIFVGIGNLISGNVPIHLNNEEQLPSWLAGMVINEESGLLLGFPSGVWITLTLAVVLGFVLRYTVFGRYAFALGSNEDTARLCGINVPAYKVAMYAIGGLLVGAAAVIYFSRTATGNPMSGLGLELKIIAAVVIGGGSLSGGRGSVIGTLGGAAIMAVIDSGCLQLGIGDALQRIILGVIIIAAVSIDQFRQRRTSPD